MRARGGPSVTEGRERPRKKWSQGDDWPRGEASAQGERALHPSLPGDPRGRRGGVRRHPSGEPVFPSCISAPRSGRGRACTPHLIESTAVPGGDLNTSRFRRTQPPRESTSEAADARPGGGRGRAVLGTRRKDAARPPPAPPHAASKPHACRRFRTLGAQMRTWRASWGGRRARRGQVRGHLSWSILTLRDIASPEAAPGPRPAAGTGPAHPGDAHRSWRSWASHPGQD